MSLSLTLRQFEVFLRVAELHSFSEAGKVLHVSQPALTRSVQQIEEALGARLFDRDTRNVELTAVGLQLLPIAKRVLGEVENACSEMSRFVQGLHGKVDIAALPCVAASVLPSIIANFSKSHPQVDFRISENLSQNVSEAVADGLCDFGVAVQPEHNERVEYRHLLDEDLYMVCRKDDALASRSVVPWSVFENRRFIAMGRNCSVRATTENTFLDLRLEVEAHFECQNIATAGSLVAAGLGIAAISALMVPQMESRNLVARKLVEPEVSRSIGVITRAGRSLIPAAQEFLKVLRREAPYTLPTKSSFLVAEAGD
jgi:LysR family carnitine catabolism transcriptional activator